MYNIHTLITPGVVPYTFRCFELLVSLKVCYEREMQWFIKG